VGSRCGFFGADGIDGGGQFDAQDVVVEEEDGGEGLVLGGGGDVFVNGEVGEEGFDFGRVHFGGVAFVVKEDEAFYPGDVGFLGTEGVVLGAEDIAYLV